MLNFRTKFYRMRMVFRLMQDFAATRSLGERPNFSQLQRNLYWATRQDIIEDNKALLVLLNDRCVYQGNPTDVSDNPRAFEQMANMFTGVGWLSLDDLDELDREARIINRALSLPEGECFSDIIAELSHSRSFAPLRVVRGHWGA